MAEVEDLISPPANETYTTLKTQLVCRLSSSHDQCVRQLLTHGDGGPQTVSIPAPPEEPGTGRARRLPAEHMVW